MITSIRTVSSKLSLYPSGCPEFDFGADYAKRTEHGGAIRSGRRKLARPIDSKRPMHLVVRSEKARGTFSLLSYRHEKKIRFLVQSQAKRYGVRVYRYANSGNHLHLVVRARTRAGFQNFVRALTGKVAQLVTSAKKGQAFGKFWDGLAYSRVAEWGRAFRNIVDYVIINELEAAGIFGFRKKKPG